MSPHDEAMLRRIVRETVKETVYETLSGIGFELESKQAVQADLLYLRKIRQSSELMSQRVKNSLIAMLVPMLVYILWDALKRGVGR